MTNLGKSDGKRTFRPGVRQRPGYTAFRTFPSSPRNAKVRPKPDPQNRYAGRLGAGRRATCLASIAWPLYVTLELRAMTKSQVMRESAVMISSLSPVKLRVLAEAAKLSQ